MQQEFTVKNSVEIVDALEVFENVWINFVVTPEGRMFEKITDGKFLN